VNARTLVLLIGLPSLLGWGLLAPVGRALLVVERAALALVLGMGLVGTVNFWVAMGIGLRTPVVVASALIAGALGARLIRREAGPGGRAGPEEGRGAWLARERTPVLLGALVLPYYLVLYSKVIYRRGPDWVSGTPYNFGDLVHHWGASASFAYGGNFPPEHILFPGIRFSYPILADFYTALSLRLGVPVPEAWFTEQVVLATTFTLALYALGARLGGRPAVGVWTVAFFFLTSGVGYWYFFKDLQATTLPVWRFLWNLPGVYGYGMLWHLNYQWGSPLLVFLTASRSAFFGFPLGAAALLLLAVGLAGPRRPAFLLAGAVTGLTPLFHTHTFLGIGLVAAGLAILHRGREWRGFFAMAAGVGLPGLVWLAPAGLPLVGPVADAVASALGWPPQAQQAGQILRFHPGWMKGGEPFALFWLRNVGLFPLLAVGAFLSPRVPGAAKRFCLPFALLFLLPNLFPLTPHVWDANKLFAYWLLGMCPVVGCLLVAVWPCREPFHRAATGAVVASVLLAGVLDTFRALTPGAGEYGQFDAAAEAIATEIRARTEPRARILTGPYPHSPVLLAGRKPLIGAPAYVEGLGIPIGSRLEDMRRMLRGEPEALGLIRRYRVSYALISDFEVGDFQANRAFFEANFPRLAAVGRYVLYDLRPRGSGRDASRPARGRLA
jgi:hypothetical protein